VAIALRPDYAEAYMNLGNAYREKNRLDEAIERCDVEQALPLAQQALSHSREYGQAAIASSMRLSARNGTPIL